MNIHLRVPQVLGTSELAFDLGRKIEGNNEVELQFLVEFHSFCWSHHVQSKNVFGGNMWKPINILYLQVTTINPQHGHIQQGNSFSTSIFFKDSKSVFRTVARSQRRKPNDQNVAHQTLFQLRSPFQCHKPPMTGNGLYKLLMVIWGMDY